MANKRFDCEKFEIPLPDLSTLTVECSSTRTRYGTSQRAQTWYTGLDAGRYLPERLARGYARYCNRPWESFPYENAIRNLAEKMTPEDRAAVLNWCENHLNERRKAAEKFLADFKQEWGKASPGLKDAVRAGGMIETEDQAESTLAVLKIGNFLRSLEN